MAGPVVTAFLSLLSVRATLGDLTNGPGLEMANFVEGVEMKRTFQKFNKELLKEGRQHQADLEVVLNTSPLLSPDVLLNTLRVEEKRDAEGGTVGIDPTSPSSVSDMVEMKDGGAVRGFSRFPQGQEPLNDVSVKNLVLNETLDRKSVIEKLLFRGNDPPDPDLTKLNATMGAFSFNFSQDAKFLVVSPEAESRLVLTCQEVNLGNCSVAGDTLVVNSVGDLRFGRNSFIYCGPRIVGGRRIAPGLFPYLAQLDMTKSSGVHTTCSGTLISEKWVLTAAHCLRGVEAISVYLGGTDRREFSGNEMIIQAEKFILHKSWNSKTLLGDIALVKLSKKIKFTDEISPVCLPDKKLRNENLLGKKGVAVGWGRLSTTERAPRRAYRVPLPFLSDLRCFLSYPRFFRPKVMMCTESSEERAICYGDSGGPLLYLRNQRVYQVGISSYSSSQVCGESFDVFTRLDDNYVEWINRRIED